MDFEENKLPRRQFIKAGALLVGACATTSCERVISEIDSRIGGGIPEHLYVANTVEIDSDHHFLNRISFGPWPGDLDRLKKIGKRAWLEEQLDYESINDDLARLRTRRFESRFQSPGDCFDYRKEVLRKDLVRHTLLKAIYSKRQLVEVMVNFWNDHLNINIEKGDCVYYKTDDDINVIRKHALGNFRDLIRASALSPAMLVYLDGKDNKRRNREDAPNENYARELMELHTLGVDGGYSQRDVFEAARCLTGWRIKEKFGRGKVYFDASLHDQGTKKVLGKTIAANGGEKDLDELIEIVCFHPSTARYIAWKLVRHFVADSPHPQLVEELAHVFRTTKGDIKEVLHKLFLAPALLEAKARKVKRPFRFLVSSLRAVAADTFAHQGLFDYLSRMGQEPYQHPTPDGFPEETLPWLGTLLWRWNYAIALANNKVPSVDFDGDNLLKAIGFDTANDDIERLFRFLIGRLPSAKELSALKLYQNSRGKKATAELGGLIIASPAFQRY